MKWDMDLERHLTLLPFRVGLCFLLLSSVIGYWLLSIFPLLIFINIFPISSLKYQWIVLTGIRAYWSNLVILGCCYYLQQKKKNSCPLFVSTSTARVIVQCIHHHTTKKHRSYLSRPYLPLHCHHLRRPALFSIVAFTSSKVGVWPLPSIVVNPCTDLNKITEGKKKIENGCVVFRFCLSVFGEDAVISDDHASQIWFTCSCFSDLAPI